MWKAAKVKQKFQNCLTQKTSNDAHCCGQTGCANSFSFYSTFSSFNNSQWTSTRKTTSLSRNENLYVPREGTFGHSWLEPDSIKAVTYRVDCHSCTIVIHTAEDNIDRSIDASIWNSILHMLETFLSSNIHVVGLYDDFRIDCWKGFFGSLNLRITNLRRSEEEAVHIGQFYLIVVVNDQLSNTTSSQHFSSHRSNSSNSNYQCAFQFDILSISKHTA